MTTDRSGTNVPVDRESLIAELAGEVKDRRVLDAIAAVPRELFVPGYRRELAWENCALPIGEGQTISQPLVVATMCELLSPGPDELVLDVGGGSGYHAAVLAELAGRVISLELHEGLAGQARQSLEMAGVENVDVIVADGSLGWPQEAPFDCINVAAAARRQAPARLLEQLGEGGRMVVPVGGRWRQRLELWRRARGQLSRERLVAVNFVPLIEGDA